MLCSISKKVSKMTIRMIHPLLGMLGTKQGCLGTLCTTYVRKISRTYGICMCDSHTYGTYENVRAMYAMYATSPTMYAVVFFADVLWIPKDPGVKRSVLQSEHDSKVAGHFGQDK